MTRNIFSKLNNKHTILHVEPLSLQDISIIEIDDKTSKTGRQRTYLSNICQTRTSLQRSRVIPANLASFSRNYANNLSDIMSDFGVLISNNAWER